MYSSAHIKQKTYKGFSPELRETMLEHRGNQKSVSSRLPGAEQEEDPKRDGARPDDPAGRVHAGHGAQAAADAAEAAHRAHAAATSDRAGKPGGVQRPAAERTTPETQSGAAAAAQKPQGAWRVFFASVCGYLVSR